MQTEQSAATLMQLLVKLSKSFCGGKYAPDIVKGRGCWREHVGDEVSCSPRTRRV